MFSLEYCWRYLVFMRGHVAHVLYVYMCYMGQMMSGCGLMLP